MDAAPSERQSEVSPLSALCELMGHPIQSTFTTSNTTVVPRYCACGLRWLVLA